MSLRQIFMGLLDLSDFNIVCSVLGGFLLVFGLVSYFVKRRLFLSEALIALLAGIALGPHGLSFIRPKSYAFGDPENLELITLFFSRLVLGVQLVLAGVQLPKKYLLHHAKSLLVLLGPVMFGKWFVSSTLIYFLLPGTPYVAALAIAACITPTDPILANNIVKGKFADAHIPPNLQKIITAESGANDGLGYPFLFIALYVLKYSVLGAPAYPGGAAMVAQLFIGKTLGYVIILSVLYGAAVGWLARVLLRYAERRHLIDRESFLVFAIALALFIVGTCGMIGSDDVLAAFIAGNVFTHDDWFRLETADDTLQPTIDMLLNMTIFLWFGAVCPWHVFINTPGIPLHRFILLFAGILVFRRPPVVMVLYRYVPDIANFREAIIAGWFGPIGVSAIFYLFVTLEFLNGLEKEPESVALRKLVRPVVWGCVVSSVIVHGITVPFMMLPASGLVPKPPPLRVKKKFWRVVNAVKRGYGWFRRGSEDERRGLVEAREEGNAAGQERGSGYGTVERSA